MLTVYRLEGSEFGRTDMQVLEGETAIRVLPGVSIDWAAVVRWLPPLEV